MITSLAIGATMTAIFALSIFIGAVAVAFDTRESPKIKFGGLKLAVISTIGLFGAFRMRRMAMGKGSDMTEFIKIGVICSSISLAVTAFAACDIAAQAIKQTFALQQIATAQQAIAAKQDKPPEISAECHETLALFDEWLRHDLRTGGSGRTLGHAR